MECVLSRNVFVNEESDEVNEVQDPGNQLVKGTL